MKNKVIKKYESFVLGICNCGCLQPIPIRNKRRELSTFIYGHNIIYKKGKDHPRYKHGKYENNYKVIRINGKQIREHVHIFQEYHQCCMLPWGEIHHIDRNIHNNDISNLEGFLDSNHRRIHMIGNKYAIKY